MSLIKTRAENRARRGIFLDPAGGVAGDMFLAGLCGLGLDPAPLEKILARAGAEVKISPVPTLVKGVSGTSLEITFDAEQPLRHLGDILAIVERLEVPPGVREKSAAAFARLAEVEASVHAIDVGRVHFHEVGALDTVADVVGAFWGVDELGVEAVVCAPLPWFTGEVVCAHGRLPLPAPATAKLLAGKPVYPTEARDEMITPTGALIVDQLACSFASGPEGTVKATATGYGSRVAEDRINGCRLVLYEF